MAMDAYESQVSVCVPAIPSDVDEEYVGVAAAGGISSFLLGRENLGEMSLLDEMQHRFLCDRLSPPLTLLHVRAAIEKYMVNDVCLHSSNIILAPVRQ